MTRKDERFEMSDLVRSFCSSVSVFASSHTIPIVLLHYIYIFLKWILMHVLTRRPARIGCGDRIHVIGLNGMPIITIWVAFVKTQLFTVVRLGPAVDGIVATLVTGFEGIIFTKPGSSTNPIKSISRGNTGLTIPRVATVGVTTQVLFHGRRRRRRTLATVFVLVLGTFRLLLLLLRNNNNEWCC